MEMFTMLCESDGENEASNLKKEKIGNGRKSSKTEINLG